jgi:hypothetical protein
MKPSPDVVCRQLGDGAVLIHLETNQIYELNATGHCIWTLVQTGLSGAAIRERIQEEYAVDPRRAASEIEDLLALLGRERLITGDHDASGAG